MKPEEQETYKVILRDKKEGIALLYGRYGKKLHRYALFTWKLAEDEAWDLVYKTLYKVLDAAASYSFVSEQKFGSFVFTVFINYLRQHYRDSKKTKETFEIVDQQEREFHENAAPEETAETNSEKMSLLKAELEKLEDWERMLLLLRSQDMPYSEIATFVNKPENQLKVYYQRLKATISKRMNEKLNQQSNG